MGRKCVHLLDMARIRIKKLADLLDCSVRSVPRILDRYGIEKRGSPAGVEEVDVDRLMRALGKAYVKSPPKIPPPSEEFDSVGQENGRLDDVEVMGLDELKAEKLRSQIRKERLNSGELMETAKFERNTDRLGKLILDGYRQIRDGWEAEVKGMTETESGAVLDRRLDRFGQFLADLKWREV